MGNIFKTAFTNDTELEKRYRNSQNIDNRNRACGALLILLAGVLSVISGALQAYSNAKEAKAKVQTEQVVNQR